MPKISVLTSTDPLDGAESAVVVQAGDTKKTLLSTIRTWLASTFVTGPSSSTDNAVVRFDSTTGKLLQDSAVTIADTTGEIGSGGLYKSTVDDGAAAVGFVLNTQNAFSTPGAKLLTVKNYGTEKLSIDKDGKISFTPVGTISSTNIQDALAELDGDIRDISGIHAAVTIVDTTSINLSLTGQQISADAIFGTTSGTVCQGNDARLHSLAQLHAAALSF